MDDRLRMPDSSRRSSRVRNLVYGIQGRNWRVKVRKKWVAKKNPALRAGFKKDRQRHTLPHCGAVPSAQVGLTTLFGKGRGEHHCYSHRKTFICKDSKY